MNYYDERLKELREQMASKNRLETVLKELRKQQKELSEKVDELESKKLAEQADVERLEGRSLANFFYCVVGKMDDKLTREKQEAYEAAVKYDAAYRELKAVEEDIQASELAFGRVRRSEEQYQAALKEKMEAVKASDIPEAAEIIKLEERIAHLESQEKEISEAISAGQSAKYHVESILSSLSSAEGWSTWDLLGGGLVADVAKHGHLDEAQDQVERLQVALRRFKTELADVSVQADMKVSIDGFLRFADYFFDGLFADWAVRDRIRESQSQVQKTGQQVEALLSKLTAMHSAAKAEHDNLKRRLKELVLGAQLNSSSEGSP